MNYELGIRNWELGIMNWELINVALLRNAHKITYNSYCLKV